MLINKAIKAVPAVRYALAVAAVAAVVAIVLGFKLNPQVAVFGSIIVIALMFVLLLFAKAASPENNNSLRLPAQTLVWFYTTVIMAVTILFILSYFAHWPLSFERVPNEQGDFKIKNGTIVPPATAPADAEILAKLNALLRRYTEGHPHDSGTIMANKDSAPTTQPTPAPSIGQGLADDVYENLRRQAQWADSLKLDCQNAALYRSQQFYAPYKSGPLMGQPMPRTLDDAQVQSLQDDELEMIRRYDSERALLVRAHDNAIAKMKAETTANLKFSPNDEIKDSQSFREANYEAAKLTPIADLRNNNSPTCTRFGRMDEYLSALFTKLGNY